jgi:hypothetical protein
MPARATDGTCLAKLVRMAMPILRAAQTQCPLTGPGRRPEFADWEIAVMIMAAVLKKGKSKSAQYRYLWQNRAKLKCWLGLKHFPARSTYFERYAKAHRILSEGIDLQGRRALKEGVTTARSVAIDKSLLNSRGRPGPGKKRRAQAQPSELRGVDRQADWGFSPYHGWTYGYSYEIMATADAGSVTVPLTASADTASVSEYVSCEPKLARLPRSTRYVLADGGYDCNRFGDRVEWDENGRRTGRRFICPRNPRTGKGRPSSQRTAIREREAQARRWNRLDFYDSPRGRRLYARRGQSVEPLHERLKSLFELSRQVWHRGLGNNQTQLLAAVFSYQLLLRYNFRCGHRNAQVQWILECL